MGFFSSLIGASSEWDGASYVAKLAGSKFWHSNFIDKDVMRRAGVDFAFESSPLDAAIRMPQSPMTIPGELIYLLNACEHQGDTQGARKVARAMLDLLQKHSDSIWQFTEMKFMLTNYQDYLDEKVSNSKTLAQVQMGSKQKILDELCELISGYVEADTLDEFISGYIYLDELLVSMGMMHVYCSPTEPPQDVYSLVKVTDLQSISGLFDALDLNPSMLEAAIYDVGYEVAQQFEKDCLKFRNLD